MKGLKTGGRQKGAKNKHNRAKELARAAEEHGITPLDYMLGVLRDEGAEVERRDEMARSAAPYLHARRAPEDKKGNAVGVVIIQKPDLHK